MTAVSEPAEEKRRRRVFVAIASLVFLGIAAAILLGDKTTVLIVEAMILVVAAGALLWGYRTLKS